MLLSRFRIKGETKLTVCARAGAVISAILTGAIIVVLSPLTVVACTAISNWECGGQQARQESVVTSTLSSADNRRIIDIAQGLEEVSGVPAEWFRREIERLLTPNMYGLYLQIDGSSDSMSVEIIRGSEQSAYVTLRADGRNAGVAQLSRPNVRGEVAFIFVNHARARHYQVSVPPQLSVATLVRDTDVLLSTEMLTGPGPWLRVSSPRSP